MDPYEFTDTRDKRFCEIFLMKEGGVVELYNTACSNDCPAQLWNALDVEKIKKQFSVLAVQLNGPKFMTFDSTTLWYGDKASFGGLEAGLVARLDITGADKAAHGSEPYKVFLSKRTHRMVYSKGKLVFELVDPDGNSYVLQAHDASHPMESLPKLGSQMNLPKGWQYRARTLTEDLVLDLHADQATSMIGDEFKQYYTRVPRTT